MTTPHHPGQQPPQPGQPPYWPPQSAPPAPASGPPMPYVDPYAPQVVVMARPTSGMAVASMVLGILGVLGGWCMLGLPCILAVILGHIALPRTKDGTVGGRGMAITGLILGYLFVVPWAVLTVLMIAGTGLGIIAPDPTATPTP